MKSLLLVDADTQFLDAVARELDSHFRLFKATNGSTAIAVVERNPVDLCVLDFFLGDEDGRSVFVQLRSRLPKLPCIVVCSRVDKDIALEAIDLGVNGLLEKPCPIDELRAKIEKFLPPQDDVTNMVLLEETFSVVLGPHRVVLTPIEFQILQMLWEGRNRLVKREEILAKLWGTNKVTDHTFDTHFSNMKRKLPSLRAHIQVIRGQGYVLHV